LPAMGKLAAEGKEGEGERRRARGMAVGRRKGGRSAMRRGCMEELGPLLVHEPLFMTAALCVLCVGRR
jgi:hypothetical protein